MMEALLMPTTKAKHLPLERSAANMRRSGHPQQPFARRARQALPWLFVCALGLLLATSAFAQDHATQYATRPITDDEATPQATRSSESVPAALDVAISLHVEDGTLEEALRRISEKANLDLVYGSNKVTSEKSVTLDLKRVTAYEAIQSVLQGTGLKLRALPSGQFVLVDQEEIKQKRNQLGAAHQSAFVRIEKLVPAELGAVRLQTGAIAGTVTEAGTGQPLPGVNIVVSGTAQGAATNAEGEYRIEDVEAGSYTVEASFVGYATAIQQVTVSADETTVVDFSLEQQATQLDEVVAIGYGEQQRRDLTGSVSTVSGEDLEQVSVTSIDEALQGLAAGTYVKSSTGQPGGGITVRIRGQGSVTSGNSPLYVIDGMPIEGGDGGRGNNPLSTINPQDIQSIQVLKDASATAIYGSRGSNGVVIIETKQGQEGRTQVSFSSQVGVNHAANLYNLLSAEEFITYSNEDARNQGIGERWPNEPSSYAPGTDWQDLIFENRLQQNHQINISGGDSDTRFSVSGNFLDNQGVMDNSSFRRYSFRVNFAQDVSEKFRVRTNVSASRGEYEYLEESGQFPAMTAVSFPPVYGPFNDDGSYVDYAAQAPFSTERRENPLAQIREQEDLTKVNRLIGNADLQYDLLENVELRVKVGADIEDDNVEEFQSARLIMADFSSGSISNGRSINVLNENLLEYDNTFGEDHALNVLGGFTYQNELNEFNSLQNSRFVSEATYVDALEQGAQPGGPSVNSGESEWTLLSWLGRVNYRLMGKYLFTATIRADGSSRFGKGNKWGVFPSGAVAWNVAEEEWFQSSFPSVSNLKLRASFGISGNQQIGTYSSLAGLGTAPYFYGSGPEIVGMVPGSVANPDLRWETSQQWDVGLDLGLWNQQLQFTADVYQRETSGLILPVTLPANSGFGASIQNTGSVLNQGLELSVNGSIFAGNFSWRTGANWSANRNEVLDLGDSDEFWGPPAVAGDAVGSIVREGEPVGMFWGMETNGIINDQAEADELGYGTPGDPQFVDQNGDEQITEADRTIIGNPHPDFVYGWNNTLGYGDFQLNAVIQGVYGNDLWLERENDTDMLFDGRYNTFQERFDDRWTPENTDASYPRTGYISQGAANGREGEFIVHDGSYLRLKSLTFSYNVPVESVAWFDNQGLQQARLYLKGTNLFTITDYIGFNPDVDVDSGNINQGFDQDSYPLVQTFTFGLNLTF
jgi:TonB-linked SusC/RagA family outer membrane protein